MKTPIPLPIPEGLSPEEQEAFLENQGHAYNLQHKAGSCYLYGSVTQEIRDSVPSMGFQVYVENLVEEAGNSRDPLERMLIEQLALAHHNIGRLHMQAAAAKTLDKANAYNAAAARLMGEFRRTMLALRTYRTPVVPRTVTVVNQQNLAAGDQQIAYVDGRPELASSSSKPSCPDEGGRAPSKPQNTELGSNHKEALTHVQQDEFIPQSAACECWEKEPVEARPLDA